MGVQFQQCLIVGGPRDGQTVGVDVHLLAERGGSLILADDPPPFWATDVPSRHVETSTYDYQPWAVYGVDRGQVSTERTVVHLLVLAGTTATIGVILTEGARKASS